jgi:23S rRNA (cytidine1920-2'-O)/16S rRNA (cytidine1409-2'-O)-methyltransferase
VTRRPRRAPLAVPPVAPLRGEAKLRAALDLGGVDVTGRVALDVGASAGGFTSVLLERGARRVYAVDAGHGQLRGWLRQDPRVVNLEATNVAVLDATIVVDVLDVITVDVSYLSLAAAVQQLDRVACAPGCALVGLVKPMFELRLGIAPRTLELVEQAARQAADGVSAAGWLVLEWAHSPIPGARGAREAFLFARRPGATVLV